MVMVESERKQNKQWCILTLSALNSTSWVLPFSNRQFILEIPHRPNINRIIGDLLSYFADQWLGHLIVCCLYPLYPHCSIKSAFFKRVLGFHQNRQYLCLLTFSVFRNKIISRLKSPLRESPSWNFVWHKYFLASINSHK